MNLTLICTTQFSMSASGYIHSYCGLITVTLVPQKCGGIKTKHPTSYLYHNGYDNDLSTDYSAGFLLTFLGLAGSIFLTLSTGFLVGLAGLASFFDFEALLRAFFKI